ncbi:MAG: AhpC/TSA family protein [Flaviaesturariibacter sp.]|nr:AhpC/TSA family protein [Flaviaesturariibacter sp.]
MKQFILLLLLAAGLASFAQGKPEGLFLNSRAPEFKGKDQNGADVSLKELRKKGPVVVVFYRGNWCPYCNKELKNLQDSLQLLIDRKAQVVAITPETTEGIGKTIEKTGATFPILYDADAKIARAYQVAYTLDEKTAKRYQSFDIDLQKINNQKGTPVLPVPAVYIINRDGAVTYRYFESDYKKRPTVAELLAELATSR